MRSSQKRWTARCRPSLSSSPRWRTSTRCSGQHRSCSTSRTHSSSPVVTTVSAVALGSLAAYSFTRFRFPGSDSLPLAYLVMRMLPRFVLVIPYYLLMRTFGLLNTHVVDDPRLYGVLAAVRHLDDDRLLQGDPDRAGGGRHGRRRRPAPGVRPDRAAAGGAGPGGDGDLRLPPRLERAALLAGPGRAGHADAAQLPPPSRPTAAPSGGW